MQAGRVGIRSPRAPWAPFNDTPASARTSSPSDPASPSVRELSPSAAESGNFADRSRTSKARSSKSKSEKKKNPASHPEEQRQQRPAYRAMWAAQSAVNPRPAPSCTPAAAKHPTRPVITCRQAHRQRPPPQGPLTALRSPPPKTYQRIPRRAPPPPPLLLPPPLPPPAACPPPTAASCRSRAASSWATRSRSSMASTLASLTSTTRPSTPSTRRAVSRAAASTAAPNWDTREATARRASRRARRAERAPTAAARCSSLGGGGGSSTARSADAAAVVSAMAGGAPQLGGGQGGGETQRRRKELGRRAKRGRLQGWHGCDDEDRGREQRLGRLERGQKRRNATEGGGTGAKVRYTARGADAPDGDPQRQPRREMRAAEGRAGGGSRRQPRRRLVAQAESSPGRQAPAAAGRTRPAARRWLTARVAHHPSKRGAVAHPPVGAPRRSVTRRRQAHAEATSGHLGRSLRWASLPHVSTTCRHVKQLTPRGWLYRQQEVRIKYIMKHSM